MKLTWWNIWFWKRAADKYAQKRWPDYPKIGTMLGKMEIFYCFEGREHTAFIEDEIEAGGEGTND